MPRAKYTELEKLTLLEQFRQSKMSSEVFAREHNVNGNVFRTWLKRYERDGFEGLKEARQNKHYSQKLKLEAIHTYSNGDYSLAEVALKFGLRSTSQLVNWISRYNEDKTVTMSPSRKLVLTMGRKTTVEERIAVVEYVTKDKHSYSEAATHFQVSYQQARSWVLKAHERGYEFLVDNRGHHKKQAALTDLDKANLRIRELESQLKDKELYEAFIKKFQELRYKG